MISIAPFSYNLFYGGAHCYIQASENIENGKFPEIKRLTHMIGQV